VNFQAASLNPYVDLFVCVFLLNFFVRFFCVSFERRQQHRAVVHFHAYQVNFVLSSMGCGMNFQSLKQCHFIRQVPTESVLVKVQV